MPQLSEESAADLADRLLVHGSSPSERAQKHELHLRIQSALLQLRDNEREVLLLRFVEQLTILEIAAVLDISEGAVKQRQLRALMKLKQVLGKSWGESSHDR